MLWSYLDNDMFDPDEAMVAAVDKRKFLLKRLLEDQGRFPEQRIERNYSYESQYYEYYTIETL